MKDFFPVSLGQKRGYALYLGARYTWQNMSTWSETALRARLSPWASYLTFLCPSLLINKIEVIKLAQHSSQI